MNDTDTESSELSEAHEAITAIYPNLSLLDLALYDLDVRLRANAEAVLEALHSDKKEYERGLTSRERGYLTARFYRQKHGTIRLEWLVQHPVPLLRASRGGQTVFSKAIPLKGDRYASTKVLTPKTKHYERMLFDCYEPKFVELRKASRWLGKLQRSIAYVKKAFDELSNFER